MAHSEITMVFPISALLFIPLLRILWAVLSRQRRARFVPVAAMAAAVVWLCGCSGLSAGTSGAAPSEAQTDVQTETQADAQTDAQIDAQAETQTETRADAQTDAQTETQTETQTDALAETRAETRADALAEGQPASTYLPEGTSLDVLGFDAGKADAFLLTTAHSAVLIDAGEKGFGKTILAELEARGIEKLDYMIITHFDQDHVGGAAKVINSFPVGTVLQSSRPKDSEEYEKYVKALNNASVDLVTVREDMDFTLDGVSFHVNPPRKNDYMKDDSNNASLIVTVKTGDGAGDGNILFLGDAQTERLEEFLSWNTETYGLIKIPHHGKEEPLTAALIAAVQPAYAVITSSRDEPEAQSVLDALDAANVETFLTRNGAVSIICGEEGLEVNYR